MNQEINVAQDIASPGDYECVVWYYTTHLYELGLRVYKPPFQSGETFYLLFRPVYYFEGPMSWSGADFRLGTPDECRALAEIVFTKPSNEVLTQLRLFIVERPTFRVRLLAYKSVVKSTEQLGLVVSGVDG
ncbi:MAG: hypothetical protein GY847_09360 [Proteobacteria bacterium]|nr:hypothetical protein [Pseudomonadota bacterium]